jgi:ribonuclease T2
MRTLCWTGCLLGCITAGTPMPASAFDARSGTFVADEACVATVRIKDRAGEALEAGASYQVLGVNRADATHYQLRLPDGGGDRWVPVTCGHLLGAGGSDGHGSGPRPEYVLAVSWQPAFCEAHADKPECASQEPGRFDATHFTLHGLWPQPLELTPATRAALDEAMPGTRSALDRHEWLRHGTCYGTSPEEYVQDALNLLAQLNDSAVRTVMAGRIGGQVTAGQLAQAFDASFGSGAGRRVTMACDRDGRRRLVVELRLSLAGEVTPTSALGDLLAAAPEAPRECDAGVIDPVGPNR